MNTFISNQIQVLVKMVSNPKFWIIVIFDSFLLIGAHFLAYFVRFDGVLSYEQLQQAIAALPVLLLVKIPTFYVAGLYQGMWRFTSLVDMHKIFKATFASSSLLVTIIVLTTRFAGLSRSVFIMDGLFTFILISGFRVSIRYWYGLQKNYKTDKTALETPVRRLLLLGAGEAAEKIIREVLENHHLPFYISGILDDDKTKIGQQIHGVRVLGSIDNLPYFAGKLNIDELLIAVARATGHEMQRMTRLCEQTGLPFKVIPGLSSIIDGKVSIKAMRDISYADLLGRSAVQLEQDKIVNYVTGKAVLVTGGGGSIGSELCRQLIRYKPQLIIIFDAGEENLYSIQMELLHEQEYNTIIPILGSIQDVVLLGKVFQKYRPAVVFHAAAYKHVPLVENNPWQAIKNNVHATQLLLEAAIIYSVERFVLVSTDKAVRPTNVMGASKRLTELLMLAYSKEQWDGSLSSEGGKLVDMSNYSNDEEAVKSHQTIFMAVRFGNVLGSSGSVIPLFKRQIQMGGPVTVTHPEITRYFMSIDEASQLILQAGAMGKGGEIFILNMGDPIRIVDMARDLIRLAGREPDRDIEIKFTGLREGEKLYEELITEGEGIVGTNHEKIMVLRGGAKKCSELFDSLAIIYNSADSCDALKIKDSLCHLVQEYSPEYNNDQSL